MCIDILLRLKELTFCNSAVMMMTTGNVNLDDINNGARAFKGLSDYPNWLRKSCCWFSNEDHNDDEDEGAEGTKGDEDCDDNDGNANAYEGEEQRERCQGK